VTRPNSDDNKKVQKKRDLRYTAATATASVCNIYIPFYSAPPPRRSPAMCLMFGGKPDVGLFDDGFSQYECAIDRQTDRQTDAQASSGQEDGTAQSAQLL